MKHRTPKVLLLILAMLIPALCLPGCESPQEKKSEVVPEESAGPAEAPVVVTLCLDIPGVSRELGDILQSIPGYGTDFLVDTEKLSMEKAERESAITRIRTEILAGKGPDFFLCECPRLGDWGIGSQALFPFPQQIMENRLFLPLDDYIAGSQYMEWEKLFPTVMESGRGEEGQVLLPLAFTFFATLYDPADYSPPADRPTTWDEVAASDDPAIKVTGLTPLASIMGNLADYEKDIPAFTEEELLARAEEYFELHNWTYTEGESLAPNHQFADFCGNVEWAEQLGGENYGLPRMDEESPDYIMMPSYNIDGGITANVAAFGAINRNAGHPDEAFRVLDRLLAKNTQLSSQFYQCLLGMPVYLDACSQDAPLKHDGRNWSMSEANFQSYQELLEQINVVNYPGPIESALHEIFPGSEDQLNEMVHKQYSVIKMMLAES